MRTPKTRPTMKTTMTVTEYQRCAHGSSTIVTVVPSPLRTNNQTVTVRVCHRAECIADAMAWVKLATGLKPVWVAGSGIASRRCPRRDLALTFPAAKALTR